MIELTIRDLRHDAGMIHMPSAVFQANAAWAVACTVAHKFVRWTRLLTGADDVLRAASTFRRRVVRFPAGCWAPPDVSPCGCLAAGHDAPTGSRPYPISGPAHSPADRHRHRAAPTDGRRQPAPHSSRTGPRSRFRGRVPGKRAASPQ